VISAELSFIQISAGAGESSHDQVEFAIVVEIAEGRATMTAWQRARIRPQPVRAAHFSPAQIAEDAIR